MNFHLTEIFEERSISTLSLSPGYRSRFRNVLIVYNGGEKSSQTLTITAACYYKVWNAYLHNVIAYTHIQCVLKLVGTINLHCNQHVKGAS